MAERREQANETETRLFAPVDLTSSANATREGGAGVWHPAFAQALADLPAGEQRYWGIPFAIAGTPGPGSTESLAGAAAGANGVPCWVLIHGERGATSATVRLEDNATGAAGVTGSGTASPSYLVFLHVCGTPADTPTAPGSPGLVGPAGLSNVPAAGGLPQTLTALGAQVAEYVLVYADGSEHRQPIRWRFEISGGQQVWGQRAFAARSNPTDAPLDFRGPYPRNAWGHFQTSVETSLGQYWVYALPNPHAGKRLMAVRIEATGATGEADGAGGAAVAVAAITRFYGRDHPLRHRQLQSFRVTLPATGAAPEAQAQVARGAAGGRAGRHEVSIDLGIVARKYAVPAFDPDAWLNGQGITAPLPRAVPAEPVRELLLDLTASADATLRVDGHEVPLRPAYDGGVAQSTDGTVRVEVLTPHKTWVHVTVQDDVTGKPSPSRVHFRAPDGRYLPPYGYRHEVNDNWFEDYGADLKLHGTQYAYVDGTFQMELPVGDVYVEVFKGFEHRPVRQKLTVQPGQRALTLATQRPLNWRRHGWFTADTHVHFISPQTAWLQGQAEGLNLINLLASQWGDLFTNVGDISGGLSGASRDETLIWVGTENRQHLLGHMSLLGIKGEPVLPMTTAGANESYLGDPTWNTLAEWADEARRKDGVVVIPHFPNPYCEVAADLVLGKIDAVEINMQQWAMQLQEWYRYLNCGYRVAAVGGTDKMGAYMPVGAIRTYALLGQDAPFSFEAWGAAVRAGRTFTTTGPLAALTLDGHQIGDEIQVPARGGTLHLEARAESVVPFAALEIVMNGQVVAAAREVAADPSAGTYVCRLSQPLHVPGSAWVAARVTSQMEGWVGSPRLVAAHTSPVYVVAGGQELFNPSDATFMLTLLEGGLTWLDTLSIPADGERQARNRKVFTDARDHLHARLHAHDRAHQHESHN
jgi:hypothetical protein